MVQKDGKGGAVVPWVGHKGQGDATGTPTEVGEERSRGEEQATAETGRADPED